MVKHEDKIPFFLPKKEPKLIILGTMGSINARAVDGVDPGPCFYYNNNRNHFWKVLQHLFEPNKEPQKLNLKEKKQFLEKHAIAMTNIVESADVPNKDKSDPSDTVLFHAHKRGKLQTKKLPKRFRKYLKTCPLFFTCRSKKGITNLLESFFENNEVELNAKKDVWFWATPTRCNPLKRSLLWKEEMDRFIETY